MADAPTLPIRVTPELLSDAALYTGIAVALAIVALVAPRDKRRGLVALAAFALVMLAALAALAQYGAVLRGTSHVVVREALLALLAVAVIRASVVFVAHFSR